MALTYLALLRGVNVGGKNCLAMKELATLFVITGCSDVRTFIQSGNVVFRAPASLYSFLSDALPELIERRFGFHVPVVLRTSDELAAVVAGNPFLKSGAPEAALHVAFLRDEPTAEQVSSLDPERSPPDRFVVIGAEIYLHLPAGVANSKLTNAYFDSKLKTVSTARNWRTVNKLLAMMCE